MDQDGKPIIANEMLSQPASLVYHALHGNANKISFHTSGNKLRRLGGAACLEDAAMAEEPASLYAALRKNANKISFHTSGNKLRRLGGVAVWDAAIRAIEEGVEHV